MSIPAHCLRASQSQPLGQPCQDPDESLTLLGATVVDLHQQLCIEPHLAPPQPLVAILRRIDAHGDDGRPLVVHHDRDPALLYPELAERGWRAEPIAGEPGEVRLLLQPW